MSFLAFFPFVLQPVILPSNSIGILSSQIYLKNINQEENLFYYDFLSYMLDFPKNIQTVLNYNFSFINKLYCFSLKEDQKESIFARYENIFFLLFPLLYFYLSNMVKLSQILQYGISSNSFSTIENRYIWGSILAISLNIILNDFFTIKKSF
ncbi:MAG TPA: hypothetical protein PLF21_01225 [Exilispira sp.]|nr:hypothetical protein [Exilispira sp.]